MKHLITSGCSFSETHSSHINTWPRHLNRMLPEYTLTNRAMSSQGNGLISRGIIYEVNEKLKTNNAEECDSNSKDSFNNFVTIDNGSDKQH